MSLLPVRLAALAACVLLGTGTAWAEPASPEVRAAVGKVLTDSAAAYSAGDLKGFMESYEASPETTFVSGGRLVTGAQAIAGVYGPRFASGADLGKLSLELENVRALGPDHVLAIGRFKVDMADPKAADATGIFSLLFHKTAAGWRIAADHTS